MRILYNRLLMVILRLSTSADFDDELMNDFTDLLQIFVNIENIYIANS